MELIVNQKTRQLLAAIQTNLPHAVLLSGQRGVGLTTIAHHMAGNDQTAIIEPLNSKEEVDHESGTISVTSIRGLYEQTRSKTTSRRIIILDSAHRMSPGAQAAFLKLLEEPTSHTHFILTSHFPQAFLPTIRSRVQTFHITPIARAETLALLDQLGISDPQKKKQLEYLASGLPAELIRLAKDETYFRQRAEVMADTRTFLGGSTFDKLLLVHKYRQNRPGALQLVDNALMVTRRSLSLDPQPGLIAQINALLSAQEKIKANCSIRLQLTAFVIQ